MASQTQDAASIARTRLNDVAAQIWTDARLLAHMQDAFRDMQLELSIVGLPLLTTDTGVVVVAPGGTSATVAGLVVPLRVREKLTGDPITAYVELQQKENLPDELAVEALRYYTWKAGTIQFIGATTSRDVNITYRKGLTVPAAINGSTDLNLALAEIFVGPRTAAYAAQSVGNSSLYEALVNESASKLEKLMRVNIKQMQSMPARRIPYRRGRRSSI